MDLNVHPAYMALYPEIHYTFDLFFSRLGHSQPEILADAPHRLEPGKTIPLLCLVKHADRFPVTLHSIEARIDYGDGTTEHRHLWNVRTRIGEYVWDRVFDLEVKKGFCGDVVVTTRFQIERNGVSQVISNHNYRGLVPSPLKIHVAEHPLPSAPGWHYGEAHCHTLYTDDQVEFGAPLPATVKMAEAIGLSWLAITDHSYDLDDILDNTLYNDLNTKKWSTSKDQINSLNESGPCHVLTGEEISCGNQKRKNVHVLAYGIENFIPGSGDGAEPMLRTRPELTIDKVLERIRQEGGVAVAAHPADRFSWGERLLLRRGFWSNEDCMNTDLHGLQFWNGKQDKAFYQGYRQWVEMLLSGRRISMIGGDDSHGDFNLFRQIRIPLLHLVKSQDRTFGRVRTCLHCPEGVSQSAILTAFRQGNVIVTSGPFTAGTAANEEGRRASIGESIPGRSFSIDIQAHSTPEFGNIEEVILVEGDLLSRHEHVRKFSSRSDFPCGRQVHLKDIRLQSRGIGYVRWEVISRTAAKAYHAFANPIWIEPPRMEQRS